MNTKPVVVSLAGPTACHKTEVSVRLAKNLNGEIVSADSVAVYRKLDIGSAKPALSEREGIPHHMIDVADITDTDFSVSRFRSEAIESIDSILERKKLPIVVGGSGLYLDAIFSEMSFSAPSDQMIRAKLEEEYRLDPLKLHARLCSIDPITSARLHPNDAKRIVRALEVYEVSGRTFSDWNQSFQTVQEGGGKYHILRYALNMDRAKLYERINLRVDKMFEAGLLNEAYALFREGLTPDRYSAMQSIGYAQLYEAFTGRITVEEAREQIKQDTRRFAKRQLTWFRRNQSTKWFFVDQYGSIDELITAITQDIEENTCIQS